MFIIYIQLVLNIGKVLNIILIFIVKLVVTLIPQTKNTMFNTIRTISKLKFTIKEIEVISLTIIKYTKKLVIIITTKPSKPLY